MSIKLFLSIFILTFGFSRIALAVKDAPLITNIQSPVGMIYDKQGNLFVAEWGAGRVSKFTPLGKHTIVIDSIPSPSGLAFDNQDRLFIASYSDGKIYTLEKEGGTLSLVASGFSSPTGLLWSNDNTLLVANRNAGEIVKVFSDGKKDVISRGHRIPVGIAQTTDGTIYVSCYGGSIDRISLKNKSITVSTQLHTPGVGIIADREDILAVDYGETTVARITQKGEVTTVIDGLQSPVGLTRMPDGRVLVGTWKDNAAFAFSLQ